MAETGISSGAGLRAAFFFQLDSSGYPSGDQSGADGYWGIPITGVQEIPTTVPDPQVLSHIGDDITFATDTLAPATLPSVGVNTGKSNQTLDAIISGTIQDEIGDGVGIGRFTDRAGQEIQGAMLYTRQALDTDPVSNAFGDRKWQTFIYLRLKLIPKGNNPAQGATDVNNYTGAVSMADRDLWGIPFTDEDNGYEKTARRDFEFAFPAYVIRFDGDGTTTTFNLPYAPISVAKTPTYINGVLTAVSSINAANKTMTISPAPDPDTVIVSFPQTNSKFP